VAEKDESSLIGYDPLAWMHQQTEQQQIPPASVECPEVECSAEGQSGSETPTESAFEGASEWREAAIDAPVALEEYSFDNKATIVLEPVLSIQNVAQLHERLLAVLSDTDKIEIDASAVAMVDTACLQLLLILKRTAISEQKEVVFDFPSEKFIEAADLLGISEMLGVDQAAAGFF
jgi:ABC-type transporter Mla MlaB component